MELKVKYSSRFKDWFLIYLNEDDILTLTLVDTGTHADLFNM